MELEGVLRGRHVTTFLTEVENADLDQPVVLNLRAVDRVEYAALAELLVASAHLASARRRLRIDAPSDVVLRNEHTRIHAARAAVPGSTAALIARSAMARYRRRQALRDELVANGFFRALRQAYSLHAADGLLEITGIDPRLLGRHTSSNEESRRASGEERIRRVAFQWLVLGAGPTASAGDSNPLAAGHLRGVLSQDDEIVSMFDAAAIERYVVRELLQNVDEHAYPEPSGGVRAILVGAVAMWATAELGISATFGPEGRSVYMFDSAPDDVAALATVAVGDGGVGIPATLNVSSSDRDRLRIWAPDLRKSAGSSEQSVAWAFHPLSTRRKDLLANKRGFRGLSYVMGQARRYRGLVHVRSLTVTVDWSFLEGSRSLTTKARPRFPGTAVAVTLTAPRSPAPSTPNRLALGSREVSLIPIVSGEAAGLIERLIDAEGACNDDTVLAFSIEPAPQSTSLDRHLLRAMEVVTSAAGGWSRERPWLCLVPCSAGDADALLNAVEEHPLSEHDREQVGPFRLDDVVLVLGVDGAFAWVGGSAEERAALTRATSLGRGVPVLPAANPVVPPTPWLRSRGVAAGPIAGEVDLLDGIAAAVAEWLTIVVGTGDGENVAGVYPGEHLLGSLKLTDPLIRLAELVERNAMVTALACALGWKWRARMPADMVWRYVHTTSVPRAVAALLNSQALEGVHTSSHLTWGEAPVVVLDGSCATGNSLRSELSSLIKAGVVPMQVAGVLDTSGSRRSEVRAVFTRVPCEYLVSARLVRDPDIELRAHERRGASAFDLHGLLDAQPQAVQIGHFSRRRGRHMDVFVDVAHLFPGAGTPMHGERRGLEQLGSEVRSRLEGWRSTVQAAVHGVDVLFPADDPDRAGAFARWLQPLCGEVFGVEAGLASVPRELSNASVQRADGTRVVVLADWGAVTAVSLHAMLVNAANRGYSHALTLLLTSQLGEDQELVESSIRLIETAHGRDVSRMTTQIEIVTRLDLGYAQESECPLCRTRSHILKLSGAPGLGEPLSLRALHRSDELAVQPVPTPTRAVHVDPSQAAGPTLVVLRSRLRAANDDPWNKLEMFRELESRARLDGVDPVDPTVLAWARLVVMEPQWMAGSTIDLDEFRAVLVRLFSAALGSTLMLPRGTREEMQRLYLVALRVVSKSEYLRLVPGLTEAIESEEVILDGLLHIATILDRDYHQSLTALRLMAEALEQIGLALKSVLDRSPSDALDASRSAHYLLEQRVAVAIRRATIGGDAQRGWDVLKTVYVGRQRRHEGLESSFDPLRLEVSSSRIRALVASDNRSVRQDAVHKLLREPWLLCARRLSEDVLPNLAAIAPQLEVALPLVATMSGGAGDEATDVGLDAWRRRLLGRSPTIFEEVESILHVLESGTRDPGRALADLQDVLAWAYANIFRPQSNGGATLFECASSIPVDAAGASVLVNELTRSVVGVEARVELTLESRMFVAGPVLENVLRLLLENVVTHRAKQSVASTQVGVTIEGVGGLARLRVANSRTDPSVRSTVSGRHGLTAARRLLEPFGGRLEIGDPIDTVLISDATFVVDVLVPLWAMDSVEAS